MFVKDLKTPHSQRDVVISESVRIALIKHKEYQVQFKLKKSNYKELDLVVCAQNGNYLEPRNLIRKFKELIGKANVSNISFHTLRHTHATILMRMGENPKVVSERLGHSRIGITLDIYSHSNAEMQKQTADRFDKKYGLN